MRKLLNFPSFVDSCEHFSDKNRALINSKYGKELCNLKNILDLQHNIYSQYSWVVNLGGMVKLNDSNIVLLTAFTKNLLSFHSSIQLTETGYFGSSRILLRNIFEFLLISKYASVSKCENTAERWLSGGNISVKSIVFKNLQIKQKQLLAGFWGDLCKYTHAMIYSQQIVIDASEDLRSVELTLIYLRILIECNYHLLLRHVLNNSIKYHAKAHGDLSTINDLKSEINSILSASNKKLEPYPKDIIKAYKTQWKMRI